MRPCDLDCRYCQRERLVCHGSLVRHIVEGERPLQTRVIEAGVQMEFRSAMALVEETLPSSRKCLITGCHRRQPRFQLSHTIGERSMLSRRTTSSQYNEINSPIDKKTYLPPLSLPASGLAHLTPNLAHVPQGCTRSHLILRRLHRTQAEKLFRPCLTSA